MFKSLLTALSSPTPDPLHPEDSELALAALLVRVARTDNSYSDQEKNRIDRVLATRQNITLQDAASLRAEAETVEAEAPDTVRFTRTLKEKISYEDRSSIFEALWDVALADGTRDAEEEALIRLSAKLLGISDVDSALARQKVEDRRSQDNSA
ncbi:TerB family tellurite resistance protein [Rhodobacteraceae bacterium]|nr:TerB family tellurite resistance protein [Paracoccaceae bacterium]